MSISSTELIKKWEGFKEVAYVCPAGVTTIGYGSTAWEDGSPIKRGQKITKDKAEGLLNDYLIRYVRPKLADLNLNPSQQAAIESLCYNIGINSFLRSKCYKALKARDWGTFIREYDWIKAGGKVLTGLIKRRTEELYLFFKDM